MNGSKLQENCAQRTKTILERKENEKPAIGQNQ
uniref:Uncharacterized protein n=1 Tax=Nelumbo nucifera TaxID=4432 RepID=A0A822XS11_NELNU|nr:TPA_asm: hypothetical protein HUJ06_023926 [Nelumbo nucifera]